MSESDLFKLPRKSKGHAKFLGEKVAVEHAISHTHSDTHICQTKYPSPLENLLKLCHKYLALASKILLSH